MVCAGTVAALAVAATTYMGQLVTLAPWMQKTIPLLLILSIAIMNVRGTRGSASVLNWTTGVKVLAIVVMSILLLTLGQGASGTAAPALVAPPSLISAAATAMISVLWAYEGWQYVTFVAGEAKDPQRTIPRALITGTVILIVIYILANLAYASALGTARMAASDRVAGEAVAAVLGPTAGKAIALAIIISMYSAAHATVITVPRVYFSMAQDGLFFRKLSEVHPRFGTPAVAVVASCAWAAVLAMTGTFEQLLTYVVFIGWIFYALGAAAVIALRIKRPLAARPFRVPGYPITPALFVVAAAVIVGNTVFTQPLQAVIGLGVVMLGAPAYLIWKRRLPT